MASRTSIVSFVFPEQSLVSSSMMIMQAIGGLGDRLIDRLHSLVAWCCCLFGHLPGPAMLAANSTIFSFRVNSLRSFGHTTDAAKPQCMTQLLGKTLCSEIKKQSMQLCRIMPLAALDSCGWWFRLSSRLGDKCRECFQWNWCFGSASGGCGGW